MSNGRQSNNPRLDYHVASAVNGWTGPPLVLTSNSCAERIADTLRANFAEYKRTKRDVFLKGVAAALKRLASKSNSTASVVPENVASETDVEGARFDAGLADTDMEPVPDDFTSAAIPMYTHIATRAVGGDSTHAPAPAPAPAQAVRLVSDRKRGRAATPASAAVDGRTPVAGAGQGASSNSSSANVFELPPYVRPTERYASVGGCGALFKDIWELVRHYHLLCPVSFNIRIII
jgi:hypothetical protein